MSPEMFNAIWNWNSYDINAIDKYKEDVFCLGMTFLTVGVGKNVTNIY